MARILGAILKRPVGIVLSAVFLRFWLRSVSWARWARPSLVFSASRIIFLPLLPHLFPHCLYGWVVRLVTGSDCAEVWRLLTLIGLVRLRSWAHYSALVIGGCMAICGTTSTVTTFAMPYLTRSMANQHSADTHILYDAFLLAGAL